MEEFIINSLYSCSTKGWEHTRGEAMRFFNTAGPSNLEDHDGLIQTAAYMNRTGTTEDGHLVIFDRTPDKRRSSAGRKSTTAKTSPYGGCRTCFRVIRGIRLASAPTTPPPRRRRQRGQQNRYGGGDLYHSGGGRGAVDLNISFTKGYI